MTPKFARLSAKSGPCGELIFAQDTWDRQTRLEIYNADAQGRLSLNLRRHFGGSGDCEQGHDCRPVIDVGNFDLGAHDEFVMTTEDGHGKVWLVRFEPFLDAQGELQLHREAEVRLGPEGQCDSYAGCKPFVAVGDVRGDARDEIVLIHEDAQGRVALQLFDAELNMLVDDRMGVLGSRCRGRDGYAYVEVASIGGDAQAEIGIINRDDNGKIAFWVYNWDGGTLKRIDDDRYAGCNRRDGDAPHPDAAPGGRPLELHDLALRGRHALGAGVLMGRRAKARAAGVVTDPRCANALSGGDDPGALRRQSRPVHTAHPQRGELRREHRAAL